MLNCLAVVCESRHVNRRTDEWKSIDDLDLDTVVLPGTYNFSESEEEVEGEGHEVLGDHNAIREHNELTKVKNINEVELGRYCMKAWCKYDTYQIIDFT